MSAKLVVSTWVVAAVSVVAVLAQQQPSFKTGIDLVTIDVRVVDASGNPVAGLRPEDFAIRVDGRARRAVTAQFVDYSASSGAGPGGTLDVAGRPLPLAPAAPAAAPLPARTIFLLVDEANIRAGSARFAVDAAVAFIDRVLAQDRVGLLTIPFSSTRIEATTDRGSLKQALQRITGHLGAVAAPMFQGRAVGLSEAFALGSDQRSWGQVILRECVEKKGGEDPNHPGEPSRECVGDLEQIARAQVADVRERMLSTARSVTALLNASAEIPGPKTFILLSQELPVPNSSTERKAFQAETANIAGAAARAQASVYVLQLDAPIFDVEARIQPPTAGADADARSFGLETVTTLTGGRRLMISGRAEAAFDRIARETSASYLLAFEADPSDRDGNLHIVAVSTTRKGIDVRARRTFAFDDKANAPPPPAAPPTAAAAASPAAVPPPAAPPTAPVPVGTVSSPLVPAPSDAGPRPDSLAAPERSNPAGSPPARQASGPAVTLDQVLRRMGDYVAAYGERAALMVAAEKYTQRVNTEGGTSFPPRRIVAEFAIVKAAGPVGWIGFRDVVEVDGESLTDRRDRLLTLLSDTNGDAAEATRISNESARFNIGPISRNFNVPTTTLFFFHPANLGRFTFKAKGTKKIENVDTWVLEFKETRQPSMVMTRAGKDVPCEGTVWVSPADGAIVRTLVSFRGFADDRVLQDVRDKSGEDRTSPRPGQQGPASVAPPATPPQPATPPAAQPPSGTKGGTTSGQNQPAGFTGSSGSRSAARADDAESIRPTAQLMFNDGFPTRKLESLARIDVTYKRHDRFGMWLPAKMSELYEGPIPRGTQPSILGQATTTADYTDFKQFTTSAKITSQK